MDFKSKIHNISLLRLMKHQLVAGSLLMIIGTTSANIGNYLYHLLMGRMLGPKGYGELESVISLFYLLTIVATTLTLVIVKVSAQLKARDDLAGISWLLRYSKNQSFILGGVIFLLIFFLSPFLVNFLHLSSVFPLLILGIIFIFVILVSLNRGVLQGLLEFKKLVIAHLLETYSKVAIAFLLVFLGLGVDGAMLSFLISGLGVYILTLFFLKPIQQTIFLKPALDKKIILKFALPVFLGNLSFTSLYTADIILVKHFFVGHEAGLYAALAVLGKIIFFASSAVTTVMFPLVVDRYSRGKNYKSLLFFSLGLVLLICLGICLIYFSFPQLMISLLFGQEYLEMTPLLGMMAIFISLYSLSYLLFNFFLSIDKVKTVIFPIIASIGQVFLIWFFPGSLKQVLQISIFTCGLLLFSLLLYYGYGQIKTPFSNRPRL